MANIVLSSPEFFAGGTGGASKVVGYESGKNRVARYSFTAPSTGATSVSLEFTGMWYGAGTQPKTLRFYIGTNASSHVNAGAGSTYTGVLNINTNGYTGYLGSANINLMPSGTYYLFVFPDSTTFGWYNWGGTATMTSGGAYGASTITSAGALTLGNSCNVKWTPVSASFRYRLKFSLGSWSYTTGLIHPNTTAAYTYTGYVIPLDVASQIPNSAKGTMTVQLTSYDSNGSTQVGAVSTATFAVTVPDNSSTKPTVSMELSLVSDLAYPFDGFYIQNLTRVAADISASGKYGASISEKQMVIGNGVYSSPFESDVLTGTGDVTVTAKATDSRGFSGKAEHSIYVIPYSKPALVPADGETNIVCKRCDEEGNITDSGTWLKIKAKRSYSPVVSDGEQFNSCLIRYRCNGGGWVTILSGDSYDDEVDTVISNVVTSTTAAYTIEIGVLDDLGYEASTLIIVPSDSVEFNLRDGGNGAAFGEYAQEENVLSVAAEWEMKVKGNASVGGSLNVGGNPVVSKAELINLIYPVGSIYMSVNSVSPTAFLGGTWEQIEDRFLLAAGSSYAAGATGGETTHTLTESEMPVHSHITLSGGGYTDKFAVGAGSIFSISPSANITAYTPWTTAAGGGAAHNNMPPYLAVYIWKRTA